MVTVVSTSYVNDAGTANAIECPVQLVPKCIANACPNGFAVIKEEPCNMMNCRGIVRCK